MADLFSTGVRPLVDDFLAKKAAEVRNYGEYWSASSGGLCMRLNIFRRLGVPPVSEDARKQRVFSAGDIFHEWMQRITREAGISIAQELELQDEELMIRGHIDDLVLVVAQKGIVTNSGDNSAPLKLIQPIEKLILYDYKTQNSRAFHYKRPDMSRYHKYQLGTYMMMLRKGVEVLSEGGIATDVSELSEGRILKISKDDLCMTEEQLLWSPELEREITDYWKTLNECWKSKTLPKCTCADYEGGFLAKEKWNDYFYNGEPCSLEYYQRWKKEKENG